MDDGRRAAWGLQARSFLGALVLCAAAAGVARSAETLPPPPAAYFNDYAGIVSEADAQRLDAKLRAFADQTSTQVVVSVFRKLPSPSLEDFTVRTAQSWRVGREDWDNGAVFFVFVEDRKMRIETGYGLEGALPDILAGRILDEQVRPRFRVGDWAGGLEAGIDGIIAATRGEYTAPPRKRSEGVSVVSLAIVAAFVLLFLWLGFLGSRQAYVGRTYGRRGWRRDRGYWGGWGGGSWGGGGWSGGGGSLGGGGFSGGGGSFGGGGASSNW